MPNATNHQIATYVSDMLALVREAAGPLAMQADDEAVHLIPEASALVPRMRVTIDNQVNRIHDLLDTLGGHETSALKNAVAAVLGGGGAAIGKMRVKTHVSKMLRDDYTSLSLMSISYELLNATALGLGEPETAKIAQTGFQEVSMLLGDISRTIPAAVIHELRNEGLSVNAVAIENTRNDTKKAWSSQRPIVN